MDGKVADASRTFTLKLQGTDPRPLSRDRLARWMDVARDVDVEYVRVGLCFVAELLELLDGGMTCHFTGGHRVHGFGAVDEAWTLSTGRLRLTRELGTTFDSESCRVRYEVDRFNDASGGPGPRLGWDGQWLLSGGLEVEILEVNEPLAVRALLLAEDCYQTVRSSRIPPEPTAPSPPPPPIREPLSTPPEHGFALVWLDLDCGYVAGHRVICFFATREDGETYLAAHLADYLSGTPNRDCWTEHRIVELRDGKLSIPWPTRK